MGIQGNLPNLNVRLFSIDCWLSFCIFVYTWSVSGWLHRRVDLEIENSFWYKCLAILSISNFVIQMDISNFYADVCQSWMNISETWLLDHCCSLIGFHCAIIVAILISAVAIEIRASLSVIAIVASRGDTTECVHARECGENHKSQNLWLAPHNAHIGTMEKLCDRQPTQRWCVWLSCDRPLTHPLGKEQHEHTAC